MLSYLKPGVQALTNCLFALSCLSLGLMLIFYLFEVAMRYFFNAPTRWVSDFVSYALLLTIAFALPAVTRDRGHVAITSLIDSLPKATQRNANILLAWMCAATCLIAAFALGMQAFSQWKEGVETVATVAIPKWCLTSSVSGGLMISAIHFLDDVVGKSEPANHGESA